MHREDWKSVFINQDRILKALKPLDNKIFLAGGTGLQRFVLPKPYRYSEDLDFFLPRLFSSKELSIVKGAVLNLMATIPAATLENKRWIKDEKSWRLWFGFEDNNEVIKVEILNFTCKRVRDVSFTNNALFKTENLYNLLLYKLKALCDRPDTIKDLFDIYFILRDMPKINISTLIKDLNIKFEKAIGIKYSTKNIIASLSTDLVWDIELDNKMPHLYDMKLEVNSFLKELRKAFEKKNILDFSYNVRIGKKAKELKISSCEYIKIVEENLFLANEWQNRN